MSITANSMITRAMRIMKVLGVDANPTAQEAADGLYALNSMLDSWSTERLMCYQVAQITYAWPANIGSQTIGSGGNWNTTRPTKIDANGNFMRNEGTSIDYPLTTLGDRSAYDRILLKTSTANYPQWIFYDPGYPLGTIYLWGVPTMALTLHLNVWLALQNFPSLTTALSLPPGYQAAIEYNLALWYAPEFGTAANITPSTEKQAALLRSKLKAINRPDGISTLDAALINRGRVYNIYSDTGYGSG